MSERLRLLAEDAEDLKVVSAALQDAIGKLGDLSFEPRARRVTFGLNRYRWEAAGTGGRVRAGLQLGCVLSVKARRLRQGADEAVVSLMAVGFEPGEGEDNPGGTVVLTFSGGGELRCEVECLDVVLADVSEPWPAGRIPAHDLAEKA